MRLAPTAPGQNASNNPEDGAQGVHGVEWLQEDADRAHPPPAKGKYFY